MTIQMGRASGTKAPGFPAGMETSPVSERNPREAVGGNRLLRQHDPLQQKT